MDVSFAPTTLMVTPLMQIHASHVQILLLDTKHHRFLQQEAPAALIVVRNFFSFSNQNQTQNNEVFPKLQLSKFTKLHNILAKIFDY